MIVVMHDLPNFDFQETPPVFGFISASIPMRDFPLVCWQDPGFCLREGYQDIALL
jgi:hypothetical protein